ncbi:MAG: iron export ABC transporter permease subunit FetB [Acidimicrobiia bacterium]
MNGDIGYVGLALSAVLIAVAIAISALQQLGLTRNLIEAGARALGQLLLVGWALELVVDPDKPLVWSWLWVVVMVVFATLTMRRRAPNTPGVAPLTFAAFTAALVIAIGVLFGLGVFDLNGRTLVPLAGMVVGNSISTTALVARRITDEFIDKREEIEARLALGQSGTTAARPYLRSALQTALIPQIETTKSVGVVFLPGAMVGLILAGADPMQAVKVQVAVMYTILGSVATTTTVIALGLGRMAFTDDQRLRRWTRA